MHNIDVLRQALGLPEPDPLTPPANLTEDDHCTGGQERQNGVGKQTRCPTCRISYPLTANGLMPDHLTREVNVRVLNEGLRKNCAPRSLT